MDYASHIFVLACIFASLAVSLDLLVGHTGLVSFAHAAFFGIGAYALALLTIHFHMSFWLALIAGGTLSALASVSISLPSLRLSDDYFVIMTFGLQMIIFAIFNNWTDLTQGPLGLPGIPHPKIAGWQVDSPAAYSILAVVLLMLSCVIARVLTGGSFGRVLHAIRTDELFAQSVGKSPMHHKMLICAISASIAGVTGGVYAGYATYIDPTSFSIGTSILVLCMVIIGGAANAYGAAIGALFLIALPEGFRFIGFPDNIAANLRQIVYGVLVIALMMYRPQGLIGKYSFERRTKADRLRDASRK